MNELIREIEEDIRRERFNRLWHRFGRMMVGLSVAVVLVTIGVVVMQNSRESAAMESTAHFIRGIDRMNIEDFKGAIAIFDEFTPEDKSYYALAMLQKAKAQESLDDRKGAAATYQQLAASKGLFSNLGELLAPSENGQVITPDKSSPFYYTQLEWRGWQLFEQGKKKEAVDIFMGLRAELDAPMSLRVRMNEVVQHVAPERLRNHEQNHAAPAQ